MPTTEFDDRTENTIKQFQRDYMNITPTGKICGSLLNAIDEFSSKFDLSETIWSQLKCSCTTKGKMSTSKIRTINELNNCNGFGDQKGLKEYKSGHTGEEAYYKYEYPGLHRSLLFGLKGLLFYLSKQSEYSFALISSGYRCRFKQYSTTNHQGKAIDIQFNKGSWQIREAKEKNIPALKDIRDKFFTKYLDAKYQWKNEDGTSAANCFSLEPIALIKKQDKNGREYIDPNYTYSWIHMDVRQYQPKYLLDDFFCKNSTDLNKGSIITFARKLQLSPLCSCQKKIIEENITVINIKDKCTCKTLLNTYRGKEREAFYRVYGTELIQDFEKRFPSSNKFKALYVISQRRQESDFDTYIIGNNPMNLKCEGDLGWTQPTLTSENYNGKNVKVKERFANFSTKEEGMNKYYSQLTKNWKNAEKALISNDLTIHNFMYSLQYEGVNGAYATGQGENQAKAIESYLIAVKEVFVGVRKDYIKWYKCKLTCPNYKEDKEQIKKDLELLEKLK